MKDQVVDLETAKGLQEKLESVGIKTDTLFGWRKNTTGIDTFGEWFIALRCVPFSDDGEWAPAPTLTEMLDILPDFIEDEYDRTIYNRHLLPGVILYERADSKVLCKSRGNLAMLYKGKDGNYATAAAKLMIDLIDNGYIKKLDK